METLSHFGDIRIFAEIHRSPTTLVYKGYDPREERLVLLKVLRSEVFDDPEISKRFVSEASLAARIRHPNVALIYDSGRDESTHYLISEFIEGQSLREIIAAGKIPWQIAFYILRETAIGIAAAHSQKVLHLDVKPSNILVSHDGQVKLVDFGMSGIARSGTPKSQEVTGTIGFIAPEIILGHGPEKSADIFSLGATFFEMLTAQPAFPRGDESGYFETVVNSEPFWANLAHLKIPQPIILMCKKMLARNPGDRYPDSDNLLADLKRIEKEHHLKMAAVFLTKFLLHPNEFSPDVLIQKTESIISATRKRPLVLTGSFTAVLLMLISFFILNNRRSLEDEPVSTHVLVDSTRVENDPDSLVLPSEIIVPGLIVTPDNHVAETPVTIVSEVETDSLVFDEKEPAPAPEKAQAPLHGWLSLRCTPWATVYVDNDSIGQTPIDDSLLLAVGNHEIRFVNPDFPMQIRQVSIEAERRLEYEFSFWSSVGLLNLNVSPWAVVFIDGDSVDTVPPQSRPFIITPGSHTLALRHPDFGEWRTEVEFFAGEEKTLTFDLKTLLKL